MQKLKRFLVAGAVVASLALVLGTLPVLTKALAPMLPNTGNVAPNVLSLLVPQQSVTVISPNGGETYNFGSPMNINWTSSGTTYVYIYLQFPDGDECYLQYASASQNSTSVSLINGFQCEGIARTLTAGQYKVLIYGNPDGNWQDTSDNYFSIVAATPQASIKVISPSGIKVFSSGSPMQVGFSTVGLTGQTIQIDLYNPDTKTTYLLRAGKPYQYTVNSDGVQTVYDITVPSVPSGKNYQISLRSICNQGLASCQSVTATSKPLTIISNN